jgi:hypothetical protein
MKSLLFSVNLEYRDSHKSLIFLVSSERDNICGSSHQIQEPLTSTFQRIIDIIVNTN